MTNFVTTNVVQPTYYSATFVPDQLVYDTRLIVTKSATLAATTKFLPRGTIVALSGSTYIPSATADGSLPLAILATPADINTGTQSVELYIAGEFNANAVSIDQFWDGQTTGTLLSGEATGPVPGSHFAAAVAAVTPVLKANGIHLKVAVPAQGANYPVTSSIS